MLPAPAFNFDFVFFVVLVVGGIIGGGVVHEYGHAWAALRCGDDTAKQLGRLSFNPRVHIDPIMTILVPVVLLVSVGFAFGGMRPVPVMPAYLRRPDRDMVWTALAGPGFQMLFVLGVLAATLLLSPLVAPGSWAFVFLFMATVTNVAIAVFNLIPIPPLDGSRVLRYWLPPNAREVYDRTPAILGFFLILLLLNGGVIHGLLGPVVVQARNAFLWLYQNAGLHNLTGTLWS